MSSTKIESVHKTAGLVYCLWLLGILFGITAIIGVIISHSNLKKARDTHAYSHFVWQICSFWIVFIGLAVTLVFWPSSLSAVFLVSSFFIWLFSGLFGSWYLSKSKRIRYRQREHDRSSSRNSKDYLRSVHSRSVQS